jgi:hypothetical protein
MRRFCDGIVKTGNRGGFFSTSLKQVDDQAFAKNANVRSCFKAKAEIAPWRV